MGRNSGGVANTTKQIKIDDKTFFYQKYYGSNKYFQLYTHINIEKEIKTKQTGKIQKGLFDLYMFKINHNDFARLKEKYKLYSENELKFSKFIGKE